MTELFDDTQKGFSLTDDQITVLNLVKKIGINSFRVRDKAVKAGVERPLDVINELYELGFIGKRVNNRKILILTRIR